MSSITSADSVFTLSVPNYFPAAFQLQQYAVDDSFSTDDLPTAEVRQGVDGRVAAGWIPSIATMHINFEANSESIPIFYAWMRAQKQGRKIYKATGNIRLNSVSTDFELINGTLTLAKVMPDGKKLLGPQKFTIAWEDIIPTPF